MIRTFISIFIISWSAQLGCGVARELGEELGSISGPNFNMVELATRELTRYKLKIENYNVQIIKRGETVLVYFANPKKPPDVFGSILPNPDMMVELTGDGKTIVKSWFLK